MTIRLEPYTGTPKRAGDVRWVTTLADLPSPVGGVITLPDGSAWVTTTDVDLGPNRLLLDGAVGLSGFGANTTGFLSTELTGAPLVTVQGDSAMLNLYFSSPTGVLAMQVDDSSAGVDLTNVNFFGGRGVEIADADNFIGTVLGFFGETGYEMAASAEINSLTATGSIFACSEHAITIDPTARVNRRLRLTSSAIVAGPPTAVGLDVPAAAIVGSEQYILQTCDFSGSGTYLAGADYLDDIARFEGCRGIRNSSRVGALGWTGNATVTSIASAGVAVKAAGTAVLNALTQRFDMPVNGRLRYTSALQIDVKISVAVTLASGNNQDLTVEVYKNGAALGGNAVTYTTSGTGDAQNVAYQAIAEVTQGDYFELYIANETGTTDITASQYDLLIQEI